MLDYRIKKHIRLVLLRPFYNTYSQKISVVKKLIDRYLFFVELEKKHHNLLFEEHFTFIDIGRKIDSSVLVDMAFLFFKNRSEKIKIRKKYKYYLQFKNIISCN